MSACCRCPEPHDNWPAAQGGLLCLDCWEAESAGSWWAMWQAFDGAGLPLPLPQSHPTEQQP
jgi:hypothetical protein